jgi:hypothetical protein
VKVTELLSIEICDQAVMEFLAPTDIGNFLPNTRGGARADAQQVEEERPECSP